MNAARPVWRSMLFVPAHIAKFVEAAHRRGADACILDLEDSVPPQEKAAARLNMDMSAAAVSRSGAAALVRLNAEEEHLGADVRAAVGPDVRAVMLPKVNDPRQLQGLDSLLAAAERQRGIAVGSTGVIAQIEDVHGLARMDEIATATPRLIGLTLGSEDFSLSAGIEPCEETLFAPNQQLVFACRRAAVHPFGFPGSIAQFRDLPAFAETVAKARRMGFVGACAIHPDQVAILNDGFRPSAAEVAHADALVRADAQARANGQGAFEYQGRMVDAPVVARAHEVLLRAGNCRPA